MEDPIELVAARVPRKNERISRILLISFLAVLAFITVLIFFFNRSAWLAEQQERIWKSNPLPRPQPKLPQVSSVLSKSEIQSLRPVAPTGPFDPYAGPMPFVVLFDQDPWANPIGSDNPSLVIYEDGESVWRVRDEHSPDLYLCQQLSSEQLRSIKEKIAGFGSLSSVFRWNELSDSSDQGISSLFIRLGEEAWAFSMYGHDHRELLPAGARALLDYLKSIRFPKGEKWKPQYIEAMLSPWNAKAPPVEWPEELPGLESPRAIRRGDQLSIFVDEAQRQVLSEFVDSLGQSPVSVGGKTWQISLRETFPSEPVWRNAIRLTFPK